MDYSGLIAFLRSHRLAVQSSVSPQGASQSAVVGVAISDDLEIVFDTLSSTRKAHNLQHNPHISFVVGGLVGGDERSVQFDGVADVPTGSELDRIREIYFRAWPDGRDRLSWPGILHVRTRPTWIRYSDYLRSPPEIVEWTGGALSSLIEARQR